MRKITRISCFILIMILATIAVFTSTANRGESVPERKETTSSNTSTETSYLASAPMPANKTDPPEAGCPETSSGPVEIVPTDDERVEIAVNQIPTKARDTEIYEEMEIKYSDNPAAVAWIFQDNAYTRGLIMKGEDNDYFLHHDEHGNPNKGGCIFLDVNCDPGFSGLNTIIHGHNMADGTKFGSLKKYITQKGYYRSHPHFIIRTPYGIAEYGIISVYHDMYNMGQYQTEFPDLDSFNEWLDRTAAKSIYNTGFAVRHDLPAITLSSCYSTGDQGDKTIIVLQMKERIVQRKNGAP